jgi:hypothetical protein
MESASYLKGLAVFCETAKRDISAGREPRFCHTIIRWGSSLVELRSMLIMYSTGKSLSDALLFGITFRNMFEYFVKKEIGL